MKRSPSARRHDGRPSRERAARLASTCARRSTRSSTRTSARRPASRARAGGTQTPRLTRARARAGCPPEVKATAWTSANATASRAWRRSRAQERENQACCLGVAARAPSGSAKITNWVQPLATPYAVNRCPSQLDSRRRPNPWDRAAAGGLGALGHAVAGSSTPGNTLISWRAAVRVRCTTLCGRRSTNATARLVVGDAEAVESRRETRLCTSRSAPDASIHHRRDALAAPRVELGNSARQQTAA